MGSEHGSKIDLARHGHCTVIHCTDAVACGQQADRLEQLGIHELAAGRRLILDMSAVCRLDAVGSAALARLCHHGLLAHHAVIVVGASAEVGHALINSGREAWVEAIVLPPACASFAAWR